VFVENDRQHVLIDAAPDFRTQALRENIRGVEAVLMTHAHADHMLGLDDLRVFTQEEGQKMPVYGSPETLADIRRMFPYACTERPAWHGLPSLSLRTIEAYREIAVCGMTVRPLPVNHGRMTVFGFLLGREVAYITDCNTIPDAVIEAVKGVTVLIIDGLRHKPHLAHLTVAEALAVAGRVAPRLTLLTHICHDLDHATTEAALPPGARLAYDGMQLEVASGEYQIRA
jgi:phosphoribosyl 1,2-cyclic phosphate phosphodiesterase